jgi:hypothetical protein
LQRLRLSRLKCSTTQNYAGGEHGWGGNAGGTFRRWMATGEAGGAGVFYYLVEATSLGAALMEGASLQQEIRSEMRDPSMLRNFSPLVDPLWRRLRATRSSAHGCRDRSLHRRRDVPGALASRLERLSVQMEPLAVLRTVLHRRRNGRL